MPGLVSHVSAATTCIQHVFIIVGDNVKTQVLVVLENESSLHVLIPGSCWNNQPNNNLHITQNELRTLKMYGNSVMSRSPPSLRVN